MSSTACSCLGNLLPGEWQIVVFDPHCKWHGDHEHPCFCESTPQPTEHTG
jgi:hypothetical protein